MVGLPYVGTVGACAGRVVAMLSPNDARTKFNWARVLRHEFVHVVNLQQTDFNIPHWFTEALAVYYEDLPRPKAWEQVLADAAAEGKLFTLATINSGFSRPKTSNEWELAYCQAELYAEYMVERFGDDALSKMLRQYAANQPTPRRSSAAFDVEVDEFERGYREYVAKIVAADHPLTTRSMRRRWRCLRLSMRPSRRIAISPRGWRWRTSRTTSRRRRGSLPSEVLQAGAQAPDCGLRDRSSANCEPVRRTPRSKLLENGLDREKPTGRLSGAAGRAEAQGRRARRGRGPVRVGLAKVS